MKSVKEFLTSEDTFSTVLLTILMDKYGSEFMEWDPLTCNLQVQQDFEVELPTVVQDKIQAGSVLFTSNLFHVSFETFATLCNVFSFVPITQDMLLFPSIDECLWGCTEARLLEGKDYDTEGFSHNIEQYVGQALSAEGIYKPPSVLAFAAFPPAEQTNIQTVLEDPIEFQAFWENQQETQNKLESSTKLKISQLLAQLNVLPIKNLNQDFVQNLQKTLQEDLKEEIG